ncbi:MAG: alpha/beta hydrolase family protein [Acidobacteriota bacterium]
MNPLRTLQTTVPALLLAGGLLPVLAQPAPYDPLAAPSRKADDVRDVTIRDGSRNREIPLRIYLPETPSPAPVVLFSHGLGGSREGSAYLGRHWADRGYAAVFLQHPGSDEAVWKGQPRALRMTRMKRAASAENFLLRVQDVTAVLDEMERWNRAEGHPLRGRFDLRRVGVAGHSFGAVTAQALGGQSHPGPRGSYADPRIQAAVLMSPSAPRLGVAPEKAFGSVTIPWLLMTGTRDDSLIGGADAASRRKVFPALPPGGKYELVLSGAEHSAFADRALPGDREKRNPNHHRVVLALTTAFWDAYLSEDPAARAWLDGGGPPSLLEKDDLWQRK